MISVVIPTYNESERIVDTIGKVHAFLEDAKIEHQILIADNGSLDKTCEICRELSKEKSFLELVSIPHRAPGLAFATAVEKAGGEYIFTLDADLSSSLSFLVDAYELLDHSDVVIGSKSMGVQRRTLIRVFGSGLYVSVACWLFDLSTSDYSMGCKAYKRTTLLPILKHLDHWTAYVLEISLFCKIKGVKIIETRVECEDRYASRFNLIYEGYYRFTHLFRIKARLKSTSFWLNQTT